MYRQHSSQSSHYSQSSTSSKTAAPRCAANEPHMAALRAKRDSVPADRRFAYKRALKAVAGCETPLATFEQLVALPGVGASIANLCLSAAEPKARVVPPKPKAHFAYKPRKGSAQRSLLSMAVVCGDYMRPGMSRQKFLKLLEHNLLEEDSTQRVRATAAGRSLVASLEEESSQTFTCSQEQQLMAVSPIGSSHPRQPDSPFRAVEAVQGSSPLRLRKLPAEVVFVEDSEYEIKLLVDAREKIDKRENREMVHRLNAIFGSQVAESSSLVLGDFLWIARSMVTRKEYLLGPVIERKTLNDLRTSFVDDRYIEQKMRLCACAPVPYYLLEGRRETISDPAHRKATESVDAENALEGILTLSVATVDESMDLLVTMTTQLTKLTIHNSLWDPLEHCVEYPEFCSKAKKSGAAHVSELFAQMLLCVPGCGLTKALKIIDAYPTFLDLMQSYRHLRTFPERATMLSNLVGSKLSERMALFYCCSEFK